MSTVKPMSFITTLEIPVSDLKRSLLWYEKYLGTEIVDEAPDAALIRLPGTTANSPLIYLVRTESADKLTFVNSFTGVTHSVIDFYVPDLEGFHIYLADNEIPVTTLNLIPGRDGLGGFGFSDPDGNSFGATNIIHAQ
ncbi:VOC family protein [Paenibacillus donghaensis]|nr:VOC family protein [Paenibacillus donghaensis]